MAVDGLLRSARIGRFLARLALAAALAAALLPGRAEAQGDDAFTARGVAVDATDQTAAAARALRVLAEAIETQPESLISGRRDGGRAE